MQVKTTGFYDSGLCWLAILLMPFALVCAKLPFIYHRFAAHIPQVHHFDYLQRATGGPLKVHLLCVLSVDVFLSLNGYNFTSQGRGLSDDFWDTLFLILYGSIVGLSFSIFFLLKVAKQPDIFRKTICCGCGDKENDEEEDSQPLVQNKTTSYASTTIACGPCQKKRDEERIIREYC